jgi:hypothetical protein
MAPATTDCSNCDGTVTFPEADDDLMILDSQFASTPPEDRDAEGYVSGECSDCGTEFYHPSWDRLLGGLL